ncbi:MAG: SprT-like domain-containing protein, partial [Acidobacteriota bacterium]|nr:SprT-like domain-containing protein [Acidobacteriota bacterium]
MNLSNLTTWLDEWSQTWSLPTLPQRAHFETSSRLRTTLGRCHPVSGTIRLHPALLDEPEALLREVACHEAAHVAAYLRHRRRIRPHGREWAALMTEAGFEPRARLDPARLSEKCRQATGPRGRYQHRCPVCDVG